MIDSRVVWIRVFGSLVQAWNSNFFVAIGEHLGTVICIDEHSARGSFLMLLVLWCTLSYLAQCRRSLRSILTGRYSL